MYDELREFFLNTLDDQTAGRLAEAISDAGGVDYVKELLQTFIDYEK